MSQFKSTSSKAANSSSRLRPDQDEFQSRPAAKSSSLRDAVRDTEEQLIRNAIEKNHWQMSKVAKELQISRSKLYQRLRLYGIQR